VADHIGTIHHEIKFTIQEGLDAIRDVIYNLETYDVTTIRASTHHVVDGDISLWGKKWCCLVKVLMNFEVFTKHQTQENFTKKMFVN
jgi:hypothetical protein